MTRSTINAASVAKAKAESDKLLSAAKNGGFRLSEEGARPLIDALMSFRAKLDDLQFVSGALALDPQLGSSEYARTVASHDRQGADGPQGILTVIDQLRVVLEQSVEALQRAAGLYRENEENAQAAWQPWEQ
ncbi:hypothetical protein ABZ863_27380 [Saccharomonospora sp. NPDC046836]|uniref:hypothetical protein n=1 Tax=Saccharomonospora sp. NPDC046836 TaxID=3156921 RepID=UPI0033D7737A